MDHTRRNIAVGSAALLLAAGTNIANAGSATTAGNIRALQNAQSENAQAQERVQRLRKGKSNADIAELDALSANLKNLEKELAVLKESSAKCRP